MSTGTQIALGVGIALVVFVSVLALRRREPPPPVREISRDGLARARELLSDGKLVMAVKLIRAETGLGLKDAKEYADSLADGGAPSVRRPVDGVSDATLAQAREFVAARKPILAVKVVRAETGWSLKDAKEFVDRLRQNP